MAEGIRCWDSAGVLIFDSTTVQGGVCLGVYEYSSASTGTLTFPDLAGQTVKVRYVVASNGTTGGVTVDYSLGYPRVTIAAATWLRVFTLWAE